WRLPSTGRAFQKYSSEPKSATPAKNALQQPRLRNPRQRQSRLARLWIELLRLLEGNLRGPNQTQRRLAIAQFQPEQEIAGIPFNRLLQGLQRQGKLPVKEANATGQPGNEPIPGRQQQRLVETIIGPLLPARQQHIGARQPYIR